MLTNVHIYFNLYIQLHVVHYTDVDWGNEDNSTYVSPQGMNYQFAQGGGRGGEGEVDYVVT